MEQEITPKLRSQKFDKNMTLKESFILNELTPGQASLITELENFLAGNSACFLLKGYAGTGKTFMMKGLTDWLTKGQHSFRIAAPTGRAAKIISQKTKHKAYTIHKSIYSSSNLQEFKAKDEDGTESYKFYYALKNNGDPNNTIYIIDESSMISNIYSEGEFFRFGSGYLLQDLIKYINFDNNDHSKKLIFIGDTAQLPPVNMNFSPALDAQYLKDTCSIESSEFELTEVVRQKVDSGILYNATNIRKSLRANIFNQLDINTNFSDIRKTLHEELLAKYLHACKNSIDDETIIIAYSNSSVKEYNDFVRNHFFPDQEFITVGDKVILVSNNYNHQKMELLNGDFGIVKQVSPVNESRVIKLKRKNKVGKIVEIEVRLTFRDTVIVFTDEEEKKRDIECKIIENLLYSQDRDLSSDELKAIYIDFKIRNPKLKAGSKEFKDALKADRYFNALRIKFGYAVTCHKAQGGEWQNTFLNCQTPMSYFNSGYFRWLYTGITRAKVNLYTIDEPHFRIGSNLEFSKNENTGQSNILIDISNVVPANNALNELLLEKPIQKNIFIAVSRLFTDGNLKINLFKRSNYLEHYSFSQGTENASFKIYYNNLNKITKIEKPVKSNTFSESIYLHLAQLENKIIVVAGNESASEKSEKNFEFEAPFLKEFYENIKQKLAQNNISINNIESKHYHEIYEFKRGELKATYKFHYNGKFIFKKTEIIHNRTTGLTEEINSLLT